MSMRVLLYSESLKKLMMLTHYPLIHLKRLLYKKAALTFWESRKEQRVAFREPLQCTISEIGSRRKVKGVLKDLSSRGMRILAGGRFHQGRVLRISFFDHVAGRTISIYVLPFALAALRLRLGKNLKKERKSIHVYRCSIHPDLVPPQELREFYQRALSDTYVEKLKVKSSIREPSVNAIRKKGSGILLSLIGNAVEYKVAETAEEKEQAYRLVYEEYLKRGFTEPNSEGMFTYAYQLLPETRTFVGLKKGEVVMTLSSVMDSPLGLPLDRVFNNAVSPLRLKKRRLTEFGMLAVKKGLYGKGVYSLAHLRKMAGLFPLFRLAANYVLRVQKADDIVIAIPPCHRQLYKYLCFETLTGLLYYGKYNTEAMVLRLNLRKVTDSRYMSQAGRTGLMQYFFNAPAFNGETASAHEPSFEELTYLFMEKSDLADRLTRAERDILQTVCPALGAWLNSCEDACR